MQANRDKPGMWLLKVFKYVLSRHFLAGYRKRRLNQAMSVLSVSIGMSLPP